MNFLIVDDELDESLKRTLEHEFPGSIVHIARSTEEARARLDFAERRGFGYGVVILDFMLPRTCGETKTVLDVETRQRVNKSVASRGAAVFHITAYGDDSEIRAWVKAERERNPLLAEPFPIDKCDPFWVSKLLDAIRRVVYESRVEQRLQLLFGSGAAMPLVRPRSQVCVSGSTTHEICGLAQDVEEHWEYLSEGVRNRLRQIFPLTESEHEGHASARIRLPERRALEHANATDPAS
jgi:hypothetical protein